VADRPSRARAGLEVDEEQPDVCIEVEEFESPELGERMADLMAFVRRRVTGSTRSTTSIRPELLDRVIMAPFRPLYSRYFRVETRGLENVPDIGGGLVVANHSGTVALDAVMTKLALLDHHPAHRSLRMLGANLVFSTPFVGEIARKSGDTLACAPDAERLLADGELVSGRRG
jgi:1-acyl-sn-glycerol-3-phosphate acyltransferase